MTQKDIAYNLAYLARSKFWNNKYKESLKYIKILCQLCMEQVLLLNPDQSRLCYIILFYMNEYRLFEQLYRQQIYISLLLSNAVCHCGDENCTNTARTMAMDNAFALYMKAMTNVSFFDEKVILNVLIKYDEKYCYHKKGTHDIEPLLAFYYSNSGQYEMANYYFVHPLVLLIDDRIENWKPKEDERCMALCLGPWFLFFSYAMYLHYKVCDYKMARYFYQISLKEKRNDILAHYHYGILLENMGKLKLSEKHLIKAKELKYLTNNKFMLGVSPGKFENQEYVFDICNCCGLKGFDNMKKCSRCKLVYYCSKKCQKYDWIRNGHRNDCKPNDKLSVYQKVRPFLMRLQKHVKIR